FVVIILTVVLPSTKVSGFSIEKTPSSHDARNPRTGLAKIIAVAPIVLAAPRCKTSSHHHLVTETAGETGFITLGGSFGAGFEGVVGVGGGVTTPTKYAPTHWIWLSPSGAGQSGGLTGAVGSSGGNRVQGTGGSSTPFTSSSAVSISGGSAGSSSSSGSQGGIVHIAGSIALGDRVPSIGSGTLGGTASSVSTGGSAIGEASLSFSSSGTFESPGIQAASFAFADSHGGGVGSAISGASSVHGIKAEAKTTNEVSGGELVEDERL
ncbi:uncharacterized PE-PGRS family protein PE_PGRS24, partial [Halyomorpha halys]|uniref:uncharacterized PE-PGRS family protein PE_PGRS24 n=1 Tax=Halyomorpha halys TaxID=286706 RepID=UPI0006D501C6